MDTPTNLSHEEIERQIYAAGDAVPFALFTQYRDARDEEVEWLNNDIAKLGRKIDFLQAQSETYRKAADFAHAALDGLSRSKK